jgi:ABC-2 type transport system ATP-binding protein
MIAIKINGLTKSYGENKAVDNLSLEVPENSICGFLGPNGAGKTTTFKLMANIIKKDAGEIEILGEKVEGDRQSQHLRFLQDVPELYGYMSAYEYLKFICELNGLGDIDNKIREALALVGLSDAKNKRIGSFSRGMKQRIGIAASIMPKPKVLLLDEPISALDPIGRKEVFDLLAKLRGKMTIMFSTHIIDDIERVSDKVIIINKGKKIADDTVEELKGKYLTNVVELKFASDKDKTRFKKVFKPKNIEIEEGPEMVRLKIDELDEEQAIFKVLQAEKIRILNFNVVAPTLEEIFIEEVAR